MVFHAAKKERRQKKWGHACKPDPALMWRSEISRVEWSLYAKKTEDVKKKWNGNKYYHNMSKNTLRSKPWCGIFGLCRFPTGTAAVGKTVCKVWEHRWFETNPVDGSAVVWMPNGWGAPCVMHTIKEHMPAIRRAHELTFVQNTFFSFRNWLKAARSMDPWPTANSSCYKYEERTEKIPTGRKWKNNILVSWSLETQCIAYRWPVPFPIDTKEGFRSIESLQPRPLQHRVKRQHRILEKTDAILQRTVVKFDETNSPSWAVIRLQDTNSTNNITCCSAESCPHVSIALECILGFWLWIPKTVCEGFRKHPPRRGGGAERKLFVCMEACLGQERRSVRLC